MTHRAATMATRAIIHTPTPPHENTETPTPDAPGRRTTVKKEAAVTISGGFAVAVVVLQWLVPICFSC